ncbi:MAG: hypothetical protein V4587_08405, partial [Acidobacteriota bacterium]
MNLLGILNGLPDLLRSQQTSGTAPAPANAKPSPSQVSLPNGGKTDQADLSSTGLAAAQSASSSSNLQAWSV